MALRTPLSVTPHLYMGDSTGRPLDMGTVYFGEQDKDPEFYPINLFSDDALTLPLAQPVHTKGGYLYDKGDMVEPHAKEIIYSVKVLDSYGRKVFYKGAMMRNSWNDDVIEQINEALVSTAEQSAQVATDVAKEIADKAVVSSGFVTIDSFEIGATITQRNQALRHALDGKLYRWAGDLPKVIPPLSTPTSSGGIGAGRWLEVSDTVLRQELSSPIGEQFVGGVAGYVNDVNNLIAKKQEQGKSYIATNYVSNKKGGGGTYKWDALMAKSKHDGVKVISPTVPNMALQDASNVISMDATPEQAKDFLFRKGQGETDVGGTGAWVSSDAKYTVNLPKSSYTLAMSHLPAINESFFVRRTISDGQYLYVLIKGAYGVSSELSYLSIYFTPTDGAPQLVSWVQVSDQPNDYRELVLHKGYLYIIPFSGVDKKFIIYDVRNKVLPSLVGQVLMDITNTNGIGRVIGNTLFLHSWGSAALHTYNLTDPTAPKRTASQSAEDSAVSGSMIAYDKRGYVWGALYDSTASENSNSLVRYTVNSNGDILGKQLYKFTGVTAVRRMVFANGKLYLGRFNSGVGVYEINIDNPDVPRLQKTYSNATVGDIAVFDGMLMGSRNTQNADFSQYNFDSATNEYSKTIIYNANLALAENHYSGIVAFGKNGTKTPELVYFDYGYDGTPYEQTNDYLLKEASQYEVGRGTGKLLPQGLSEGDVLYESLQDAKFTFRAKYIDYISVDSANKKTGIYYPSFIHDIEGSTSANRGLKTDWLTVSPALISATPIELATFDVTGVGATAIEITVISRRVSGTRGASAHKLYLSWAGGSATIVSEPKASTLSATFKALTFTAVGDSSSIKLQVASATGDMTSISVNMQILGCYLKCTKPS